MQKKWRTTVKETQTAPKIVLGFNLKVEMCSHQCSTRWRLVQYVAGTFPRVIVGVFVLVDTNNGKIESSYDEKGHKRTQHEH